METRKEDLKADYRRLLKTTSPKHQKSASSRDTWSARRVQADRLIALPCTFVLRVLDPSLVSLELLYDTTRSDYGSISSISGLILQAIIDRLPTLIRF